MSFYAKEKLLIFAMNCAPKKVLKLLQNNFLFQNVFVFSLKACIFMYFHVFPVFSCISCIFTYFMYFMYFIF